MGAGRERSGVQRIDPWKPSGGSIGVGTIPFNGPDMNVRAQQGWIDGRPQVAQAGTGMNGRAMGMQPGAIPQQPVPQVAQPFTSDQDQPIPPVGQGFSDQDQLAASTMQFNGPDMNLGLLQHLRGGR